MRAHLFVTNLCIDFLGCERMRAGGWGWNVANSNFLFSEEAPWFDSFEEIVSLSRLYDRNFRFLKDQFLATERDIFQQICN